MSTTSTTEFTLGDYQVGTIFAIKVASSARAPSAKSNWGFMGPPTKK